MNVSLSKSITLARPVFIAALASTLVAPNVKADAASAVSLLDNYNLIASGSVSSSSEVDGNALVAGSLSGGNYHIHNTSTAVPALTVGGDLGGNVNVNGAGMYVQGSVQGNVNMNGGGNAYVGAVASGSNLTNNANGSGNTYVVGNIAGNVNTNGGTTYYGGSLSGNANGAVHTNVSMTLSPENVAAAAANTLTGFSESLTGQTANSSYSISGNTATFTASGSGLAVFTISDASQFFSQVGQIQFNLENGAKDVLINVVNSGAVSIDANFLNSQATALGADLLWNFEDAGSIAINSQFGGTVLATQASVSTSQNIEGSLVAVNVSQNAEIHSQPLDAGFATLLAGSGTLSGASSSTVIPEPGMIALLGVGMLGMRARRGGLAARG